jgi:hypothetical protein
MDFAVPVLSTIIGFLAAVGGVLLIAALIAMTKSGYNK